MSEGPIECATTTWHRGRSRAARLQSSLQLNKLMSSRNSSGGNAPGVWLVGVGRGGSSFEVGRAPGTSGGSRRRTNEPADDWPAGRKIHSPACLSHGAITTIILIIIAAAHYNDHWQRRMIIIIIGSQLGGALQALALNGQQMELSGECRRRCCCS